MNTTRTHTEDIRNEILFVSHVEKTKGLVRYEYHIDFVNASFATIEINVVDESSTMKPIASDSELMKSINEMKEHGYNVKKYENSFYCLGCRNKGRENFSYLKSDVYGEQHLCDNCHSTIETSHSPNRKVKC